MSSARTTLWLAPETASGLDAAIAGVAAQFGRVPFPAHLTLAVGRRTPAEKALSQLARATAPLVLARDGVLATARFSRSYALQFAETPALAKLAAAARVLLDAPGDDFIPHVSLTYGAPPALSELDALSARYAGALRCDRLEFAVLGENFRNQHDVAAIEMRRSFQLTG